MAKKVITQQKAGARRKTEDGFEFLARLMKEGFDDVHKEMKEMRTSIVDVENRLRLEIRESEERLGYRIGKVSTDLYRHLDTTIEPRLENHERRIKKLELARA